MKHNIYFVLLATACLLHAAEEAIVKPVEMPSINERILEGERYLDGCGVERDLKRARRLFQEVAWSKVDDSAKAHAYLHIALMHFFGISLPHNSETALIFLKKACSYQAEVAVTKVCEYWKKQFNDASNYTELADLSDNEAGEIYAGLRVTADALFHHFSGGNMREFRSLEDGLKKKYTETYLRARSTDKTW